MPPRTSTVQEDGGATPVEGKKMTVDVIVSKIPFDAVIPVAHVSSSAMTKYKSYAIIDGKNPFEAEMTKLRRRASPPSPSRSSGGGGRRQGSPERPNRKRQRTSSPGPMLPPPPAQTREGSVSQPLPTLSSPLGPDCHPVRRPGWAAECTSASSPYRRVASDDLHLRVRYVLDDEDYEWCAKTKVAPTLVQRAFTFLEWAYVSHVRSHTDRCLERSAARAVRAVTTSRRSTGLLSEPTPDHTTSGVGAGAATASSSSSSSVFATLSQVTAVSAAAPSLTSDTASSSHACALCSKSVQLYTAAQAVGNTDLASVCERAPETGLQCCGCGLLVHLTCAFLTAVPPAPSRWMCDSCHWTRHKRTGSRAVRCIACGRGGGLLLLYRASATSPAPRVQELTGPLPMCHTGCALAFHELQIHVQPTRILPDRSVDMNSRPFVIAVGRVTTQRHTMQCMACSALSSCVRCSQPYCFETLHPSCVIDMATADFYTADPSSVSPSADEGSVTPLGSTTAAEVTEPPTAFNINSDAAAEVAGGKKQIASVVGLPPAIASLFYCGCNVYCKQHFAYSLTHSLTPSTLVLSAEEAAMKLDLTGQLSPPLAYTAGSREDVAPDLSHLLPSSPVARKRGRGRPPVAYARQRDAEKQYIGQIKDYWLAKRHARKRESARLAVDINYLKTRPILSAVTRPELYKVSLSTVRLSHFLCLVPEWQALLMSEVEGVLPLAEDEYEDAHKFRKPHSPTTTRRSSAQSAAEVFERMTGVAQQVELVHRITGQLIEAADAKAALALNQVQYLETLCQWSEPSTDI